MEIISTREFRANQTAVLTKVKNGDSIILKSRVGSFKILPVTEEDTLTERICKGLREAKMIVDGKIEGISLEEALHEL
ncbi:MAG: prevent-host-death protein [Muribaculaceae bacterium]|nr:prevent-host-death protein [Muribaculaceae bacterium]MDE6227581.1 prevent-host-death protein [Muribaculaceae bacterium]